MGCQERITVRVQSAIWTQASLSSFSHFWLHVTSDVPGSSLRLQAPRGQSGCRSFVSWCDSPRFVYSFPHPVFFFSGSNNPRYMTDTKKIVMGGLTNSLPSAGSGKLPLVHHGLAQAPLPRGALGTPRHRTGHSVASWQPHRVTLQLLCLGGSSCRQGQL